MRHVVLTIGALLGAGVLGTYAMQEGSRQVLGPSVDQAVDNAEAFSAMANGAPDAEALGAVERMGNAEAGRSAIEESQLNSWYGEKDYSGNGDAPDDPTPVE